MIEAIILKGNLNIYCTFECGNIHVAQGVVSESGHMAGDARHAAEWPGARFQHHGKGE